MNEHTSTKIAHNEAMEEEHGQAWEAFLEAQLNACGRHVMDEDLDLDDLMEDFLSHYRGQWKDEEAFAMERCCSELGLGGVEASYVSQLASFIDWDLVAAEMFSHGGYTFLDGYVFEDEV